MKVWILGPNLNDQRKGNFIAHADDCGDIQKDERKNPGAFGDVVEVESRTDVAAFVYPPSDFGWDPTDDDDAESYIADINFQPCLRNLTRRDPSG
jgi:hypothetical protein